MRELGRVGKRAASSCAFVAFSDSANQPLEICKCPAPPGTMSKIDRKYGKIGKEALAALGRRAYKKLGMPITRDRARLINRGAGLNLDQDNDCGRNSDRRGRMQHDAKRTVVGIGIYRMHVRNLNNRQQRQQDKAHHGHYRQSERLCAASSAEMCLKSCQTATPALRIHKIGCGREKGGYASRCNLDPETVQT